MDEENPNPELEQGTPMELIYRLHEENRTDIRELRGQNATLLAQIAVIAGNTKDIPELVKRVDNLEAESDQRQGAVRIVKLVGWICGLQGGSIGLWALSKFIH